MIGFLVIHRDEVMVAIDDVTLVRAIDVGDLDPQTGQLHRSIPEGAMTRIDTRHNGYVWVSDEWRQVLERIESIQETVTRAD